MKLQTGDLVPDFATTAHFRDSEPRSWVLSEELKKAPILLVFYPGDFTAVCTKQLCDYRDNWARLGKHKVQIVGVSTDAPESHKKFLETYNFPFPLLDDSSQQICDKLGMKMFGLSLATRGLILVGSDGRVKHLHRELLPVFKRSAEEVDQILREHL